MSELQPKEPKSFFIDPLPYTPDMPDEAYISFIKDVFPKFKGNYAGAVHLIKSFQQTEEEVSKSFDKLNLTKYTRPTIGLCPQNPRVESFGYVNLGVKGNYLVITDAALEYYSMLDLNEIIESKGNDGEIQFIGTPDELFRISAVEESHHHLMYCYNKQGSRDNREASSPYTEHIKDPLEQSALVAQIAYAKAKNFNGRLISFLESHVANESTR